MGILEQAMLWKLLKKHEKENVESEKEKEKLWKVVKNKKSKNWKCEKNWLLQKDCEKKRKKSLKKKMVYDCMIVDICGNEMLSSIALKIGSCVENCVTSLFLTPSF